MLTRMGGGEENWKIPSKMTNYLPIEMEFLEREGRE